MALLCLYANRCWSGGGLLTLKWLVSAVSGSVGPSCRLHDTVSPAGDDFVLGMKRLVTGRPFLSRSFVKSERLM